MKNYLLILFFLPLFFFSCEGDVRFTTDQPTGTPSLKEVPTSLIGDYVNNSDSLFVRNSTITLIRPTKTSIPISDTAKVGLYKTKNGTWLFHAGTDRYVERATSDSVIYVTRNAQIYKLGKDTVLKSFNDSYWLSMRDVINKDEWKVMQISLHKSKLAIAVPTLPKDEKKHIQQRMEMGKCTVDSTGAFSCVTPFKQSTDMSYYIVSATPDQLRNLDRRGLFRPVATFEKIK
ncbi:hypothetical protein BH09BAC5_BH09BAC5_04650 [soil metagenome]